ncbi:MAG: transketolase family protein, partial [Clostridiales bacterium]|nr:transketolase family protein [Clostridiales bacterium]
KIIGSDPGVTAAYNGGTHMPFEDMGILRCIPEITLVEPADGVQLASIVRQLPSIYGVHYIRLMRKLATGVYEPGSEFEIGKGVLLRPGKDVTIIASGIMVAEALKAAAALANEDIDARVINIFTWKPIDEEIIAAAANETGALVTCENHNIIGGLGSAVAEVLVSVCPKPLERVGINDEFGEVGTEAWLREHFNLTAEAIAAAAKKAIARK